LSAAKKKGGMKLGDIGKEGGKKKKKKKRNSARGRRDRTPDSPRSGDCGGDLLLP